MAEKLSKDQIVHLDAGETARRQASSIHSRQKRDASMRKSGFLPKHQTPGLPSLKFMSKEDEF